MADQSGTGVAVDVSRLFSLPGLPYFESCFLLGNIYILCSFTKSRII